MAHRAVTPRSHRSGETEGNRKVSDGGVLGLAGTVRHHRGVTGTVRHGDRVERLGEGADLVHLDEQGVGGVCRDHAAGSMCREFPCRLHRLSCLLQREHLAHAQLQRVGHLLQALGGHAAVLRRFVALHLLLGQSQPFGKFLLRQVAHDARLDQHFTDADDGFGFECCDLPLAQRVVFRDLGFEVVELAAQPSARGLRGLGVQARRLRGCQGLAKALGLHLRVEVSALVGDHGRTLKSMTTMQ